MIDLHYWTTPNGHKITIFLEEAHVPYRIIPVNIGVGDQFNPDFLAIAPNNRILFESGAILLYLAEKTGQFLPSDARGKYEVLQWLFWQMAGLGPMAGQNHHFVQYAPERIPTRLSATSRRPIGSMVCPTSASRIGPSLAATTRLRIWASYPWIVPHKAQQQNLHDFPHLKRWFEAMRERPAVKRAYEIAREVNARPVVSEE
jgi:GST-like protein